MVHRTSVRPIRADDFAAAAELTSHYIGATAIHFGSQPVTAGELATLWQDGLDRYPWLVATADGAFCGYAKSGAWRPRAAYAWTAETTIYLRSEHHGRGIGRLLYGRLVAVLAAQGYRSLIGGITLPNAPSVALHERLGFRPCGVVADAGFKFGRWHDVGFWQLRLRTDAAPAAALTAPAAAIAELGGGDVFAVGDR